SSREHAVWALRDYGFKAVLSTRFAEIFRGNAGKQGLVAGILSQDHLEQLWNILDENPGAEVTVDLENRQLHSGDSTFRFDIDDYARWRVVEGLHAVGTTLRHDAEITAREAARPRPHRRPRTSAGPARRALRYGQPVRDGRPPDVPPPRQGHHEFDIPCARREPSRR